MAFVAVPYFIYASNESKSVLARDLGGCLRLSIFNLIEKTKVILHPRPNQIS